jgi:hypothetical protein
VRVRDQPDLQLARRQLAQHRLGLVVQVKVVTVRPRGVHLARARIDLVALPPMPSMMPRMKR